MNSISLELWKSIEKGTGYEASGPQIFAAVIDKLQQVTDAAIRVMVENLRKMKLKEEPAQNCESFKDKIYDIAQRIEGSGRAPNDLTSLVAETFLDSEVLAFNIEATNLYTKANRHESNLDWRKIIDENVRNYRALQSAGKWTPEDIKRPIDMALGEVQGLTMLINKLVQNKTIGSATSDQNMSETECFHCHKKGHIKANCPELSSAGSQNATFIPWKRVKPAEGEEHIKTRNGRTWKWCRHCGFWRAGPASHLTEEHIQRGRNTANTQSQTSTPNVQSQSVTPPASSEANGVGALCQEVGEVLSNQGLQLMPSLFLEKNEKKQTIKTECNGSSLFADIEDDQSEVFEDYDDEFHDCLPAEPERCHDSVSKQACTNQFF